MICLGDDLRGRNPRSGEGAASRRAWQRNADHHSLNPVEANDLRRLAAVLWPDKGSLFGRLLSDHSLSVRIRRHHRSGVIDQHQVASRRNNHLFHLLMNPGQIERQEHDFDNLAAVIHHRLRKNHDVHAGGTADQEATDHEGAGFDGLIEVVPVTEINAQCLARVGADGLAVSSNDTDQPVRRVLLSHPRQGSAACFCVTDVANFGFLTQAAHDLSRELDDLAELSRRTAGSSLGQDLGLLEP